MLNKIKNLNFFETVLLIVLIGLVLLLGLASLNGGLIPVMEHSASAEEIPSLNLFNGVLYVQNISSGWTNSFPDDYSLLFSGPDKFNYTTNLGFSLPNLPSGDYCFSFDFSAQTFDHFIVGTSSSGASFGNPVLAVSYPSYISYDFNFLKNRCEFFLHVGTVSAGSQAFSLSFRLYIKSDLTATDTSLLFYNFMLNEGTTVAPFWDNDIQSLVSSSYEEGYVDGQEEGYNSGYEKGENIGYDKGYKKASTEYLNFLKSYLYTSTEKYSYGTAFSSTPLTMWCDGTLILDPNSTTSYALLYHGKLYYGSYYVGQSDSPVIGDEKGVIYYRFKGFTAPFGAFLAFDPSAETAHPSYFYLNDALLSMSKPTVEVYVFDRKDGLYDSGYKVGYTEGYDSGLDDGIGQGYENGFEDGNSLGYDNGYSIGKTDGYNVGYNHATETAGSYTFYGLLSAVFDAPLNVFYKMFDFDILGTNLRSLMLSLFTLCVIIVIVRLCLGGK